MQILLGIQRVTGKSQCSSLYWLVQHGEDLAKPYARMDL